MSEMRVCDNNNVVPADTEKNESDESWGSELQQQKQSSCCDEDQQCETTNKSTKDWCKLCRCENRSRFIDIYREKPLRVTVKVRIPVNEHPKFNFVGRLLGPRGSSLKQLQEETGTRMAIFGRGSVRNKEEEESLRSSHNPKYRHLDEDLHVEISVFSSPATAYTRIAHALTEIRKFLVPDCNDEIRQKQRRELDRIQEGQIQGEGEGKSKVVSPVPMPVPLTLSTPVVDPLPVDHSSLHHSLPVDHSAIHHSLPVDHSTIHQSAMDFHSETVYESEDEGFVGSSLHQTSSRRVLNILSKIKQARNFQNIKSQHSYLQGCDQQLVPAVHVENQKSLQAKVEGSRRNYSFILSHPYIN